MTGPTPEAQPALHHHLSLRETAGPSPLPRPGRHWWSGNLLSPALCFHSEGQALA